MNAALAIGLILFLMGLKLLSFYFKKKGAKSALLIDKKSLRLKFKS